MSANDAPFPSSPLPWRVVGAVSALAPGIDSAASVTATVTVGSNPVAAAVYSTGTLDFVTNNGSGAASVIDSGATPGTPGAPSAVAGNTNASVPVAAPTTGGTPVTYPVVGLCATPSGVGHAIIDTAGTPTRYGT